MGAAVALVVVDADQGAVGWAGDLEVEIVVLLVQAFIFREFEAGGLATGHMVQDIIFDEGQRGGQPGEAIEIILKLPVIV